MRSTKMKHHRREWTSGKKGERVNMIIWPEIVLTLAVLLSCSQWAWFASAAGSRNSSMTVRFELRFQNDMENSSVTKLELQQQVFKCQVRLAPVKVSAPAANGSGGARDRPKSQSPKNGVKQQQAQELSGIQSMSVLEWPTNVSLSIDWLRNNRLLVGLVDEPVTVINTELKKESGSSRIDRKNKSRIEIKNTLNRIQSKLTSRLKLGKLRVSDSGHYKCIARASFQAVGPITATSEPSSTTTATTTGQTQPSQQSVNGNSSNMERVEQSLESNGTTLSVVLKGTADVADNKRENSSRTKSLSVGQLEVGLARKLAQTFGIHIGNVDYANQRANETQHAIQSFGANYNGYTEGPTTTATETDTLGEPTDGTKLRGEISGRYNNERDALESFPANIPSELSQSTNTNNRPEDDEMDPYKVDLEPIDLISGQEIANDDDEDHRGQWLVSANEATSATANEAPGSDSTDENLADFESLASSESYNNNESSLPATKTSITTTVTRRRGLDMMVSAEKNLRNQHEETAAGVFTMNDYLGDSLDSTRLRLAKIIHRIVPELSCYTGKGEFYRGNVSVSADKRTCLNWAQVRFKQAKSNLTFREFARLDSNHNYCRNPTLDPGGPWCFVDYSEELDGMAPNGQLRKRILVVLSKPSGIALNSPPITMYNKNIATKLVIQRQCSISPCSEYLWIYIVAPSLGLLALLSCCVALLVRSIRRSHYKSMISKGKRQTIPRFGRLLWSSCRFAPKKFGAHCGKRKNCGNYLDDDIFEIVDDLDWSDGQTQSLSPKSTESMRLNSSLSSSCSNNGPLDSNPRTTSGVGCKLPATVNERQLISINPIASAIAKQSNNLLGCQSRSVGQVDSSMFATLRCHINGTKFSVSQQPQMKQLNAKNSFNNKSSTFIEQCDLANNRPHVAKGISDARKVNHLKAIGSLVKSSSLLSSSSSSTSLRTDSGHLISCSSTTNNLDPCDCDDKFVKANELPQLDASSVAIAVDQQPLYEGKFSQVQLAYLRQPKQEQQANSVDLNSKHEPLFSDPTIGRTGVQVAVCSLKTGATIDPAVFQPINLKLRNLNHLNLLKLIGCARFINENEIGCNEKLPSCSLVYDMAQLVDLKDWLKQQSKDSMTSSEPGNDLGTRRNLTCFAKQIALALDYLHDQNIIFKDLACRNCFLDPTKMLVKLASFNIEFVTSASEDDMAQSFRSMIRPKYLLDYYVIDSRPTDCQLVPLSWIPLESILFNKFNKQSDIWSFGCLLYELFSLGEVAFFGYSSKQVIDTVRSNLMPTQPVLCPGGIYKLMCKCLSDIPTNRPDVKQIYELLNLYSGQCSSFLDHHLCSLATSMYDDNQLNVTYKSNNRPEELTPLAQMSTMVNKNGSITKTKSYANIRKHSPSNCTNNDSRLASNNLNRSEFNRLEVTKIPLSKSANLGVNRTFLNEYQVPNKAFDDNHYDEPIA